MNTIQFNIVGQGESMVALVEGEGILVSSAQDMLDMIATASYQHGCHRLLLRKGSIDETFFDLKTGLAGEVLQKVVNYGAALAIVGDFSVYTSKALRDFIYESNKGSRIFFLPDETAALERLQNSPLA